MRTDTGAHFPRTTGAHFPRAKLVLTSISSLAFLTGLAIPAGAATRTGTSPAAATVMVQPGTAAPSAAAVKAIAYARAQLGRPYLWGGTGPGAFDCSGLVMRAWQAAGVSIARTSQDQWTTERHVSASQVRPGDLVFYAGSDGTPASPGHVGIVTGPGQMIEAYGTGYPIRQTAIRPDLVGYTDPAGGQS